MEDNTTTKNWLQRLKDESWEAELLVSAIAIFGTFKLFDFVNWVTNFFIDTLNPNQYFIAYFITFFGLIAVSVLTSMFVTHFVLRAYWVGLVGLNSVFPDYSIEDSAYSKIYTEKILAFLPKLNDSIKKVDEMCSVIFSIAFTFLFIIGYMAVFNSIYLQFYNLLLPYIHQYILLAPAIIIALGLMTQMIVSIYANYKKNKEKEKLQHINFILVKYVNMVASGPLYKSILQVTIIFGSNFKKKKSLAYLGILFFFLGFFVAAIQIPKTNILFLVESHIKNPFDVNKTYSNYYKDANNSSFLLSPEIQSDMVKSNILEVFIPIFNYESSMRETVCGIYEEQSHMSKPEQRVHRAEYLKECYKEYHNIFLDGKKIETSYLRYNNHYKTNQFGILCFIELDKLSKGLHEVKIEKNNNEEAFLKWTIPFYYNFNQKE
jgi:hypothetical protein